MSSGLVLTGILMLSLNLRPAAVSVGPVLDEIRDGLGMGAASAGLLTSLPVLAFAGFGALAPLAARRAGPHRVTLVALLAVAAGLAGRAVVDHEVSFLLLSLVAVGGMAMANVLIPSLVRLHFPDRIGPMTAAYSTSLAIGLTSAFLLTVPVANWLGSWRWGLGIWAVLALVATLPWFFLAAHDQGVAQPERTVSFGEVARTRLGWAMAVFFGLQSLQAYAVFGWFATLWRDAGFGAGTAGALVGVVAGVSIPLSAWVPQLIAKPGDRRVVLLTIIACYPVAYLGPHRLPARSRAALGGGARRGHGDVPDRADADRAALAHPRRDGRAVGLHPGHGLPAGRAGTVRRRHPARRHRRLDGAAARADRAEPAAVRPRHLRRQAATPRGPAPRSRVGVCQTAR